MYKLIVMGLIAVGAAQAAPLPMPAGYPTLLGVSCGGVHIVAYQPGFNADSTISGQVYAWTRCGGSGRGGGYKTKLYFSWHTLKWDFFGNYLVGDYNASAVSNVIVDAYGNVVSVVNGAADLTVQTVPPGAVHLLYAVPAVVGSSDAAARAAIEAVALVYSASYEYSNTVAAGNVIAITPAAGTKLAPGSVVSATVSLGPVPLIAVPNVIGSDYLSAEALLDSLGFNYMENFSYSSAALNSVIAQNPTALDTEGDQQLVPQGTDISLTISLGPDPNVPVLAIVPDVVNTDYISAIAVLQAAGFSIDAMNSTFAYSDTVPFPYIISTDPVAGTNADTAVPVIIIISLGPAPVI